LNSDKRRAQYAKDVECVVSALADYQHADGHADLAVKIRHGFVEMVEDTRKRKPEKVDERGGS